MRVLAVEDEPELASLIKANLAQHGFTADLARTVADAQAYFRAAAYDLVLLDLRLPDGDGLALLQCLRAIEPRVPVIAVTARDSLQNRVEGLNSGADDYIVKPFALEELVARMQAVLRRRGGVLGRVLTAGNTVLDTATREVRVGDRLLILPRRELAILELLMRVPGRVVTRDKILEDIYGFDREPTSNAVDANVSRLRRHLDQAGSGASIQVVRGIGYLLRSSR